MRASRHARSGRYGPSAAVAPPVPDDAFGKSRTSWCTGSPKRPTASSCELDVPAHIHAVGSRSARAPYTRPGRHPAPNSAVDIGAVGVDMVRLQRSPRTVPPDAELCLQRGTDGSGRSVEDGARTVEVAGPGGNLLRHLSPQSVNSRRSTVFARPPPPSTSLLRHWPVAQAAPMSVLTASGQPLL